MPHAAEKTIGRKDSEGVMQFVTSRVSNCDASSWRKLLIYNTNVLSMVGWTDEMTNSKALHEGAEEDFVIKLRDIEDHLHTAELGLSSMVTGVENHLGKEASAELNKAHQSLGQCMNAVAAAKRNLEFVTEILNVRKASLELKEIALRSWPKKSFIERMTWIATALFPVGGVSFVFAGGLTDASLAVAIESWSMGSLILILSLVALKRDDDEKWEFYANEFGVYRNMQEPRTKATNCFRTDKNIVHSIAFDQRKGFRGRRGCGTGRGRTRSEGIFVSRLS